MSSPYTVLPLKEARHRLRLDDHFGERSTLDQYMDAGDWIARVEANPEWLRRAERQNPSWRDGMRARHPAAYVVRVHDGSTTESGDFDVDALHDQDAVAGIVVDGDLTIEGALLNWGIDTPTAFLWVRGGLACRHAIIGSMDLVVLRSVTASGVVVVTYNHGHVVIDGDLTADRVIIDGDGEAVVWGAVHAKGWSSSPLARVRLRASDWIDEIRPEVWAEFFDDQGWMLCGDGNVDLVKALMAGRDILRPEPSLTTSRGAGPRA